MNYKDILDLIAILKELTTSKIEISRYKNSLEGRPELKGVLDKTIEELSEIQQLTNVIFTKLKSEIKAIK